MHTALTGYYGVPDEPGLRHRLEVAIGVTEHLLNVAFKDDPQGDAAVVAELKVLITRYLAVDRPAG